MDYELLKMFSAGSANDHNNKHLWIKGASLYKSIKYYYKMY